MRWEYLVGELEIDHADEEAQAVLNGVGEHGWELINIIAIVLPTGRPAYKAVFNRPASAPTDV